MRVHCLGIDFAELGNHRIVIILPQRLAPVVPPHPLSERGIVAETTQDADVFIYVIGIHQISAFRDVYHYWNRPSGRRHHRQPDRHRLRHAVRKALELEFGRKDEHVVFRQHIDHSAIAYRAHYVHPTSHLGFSDVIHKHLSRILRPVSHQEYIQARQARGHLHQCMNALRLDQCAGVDHLQPILIRRYTFTRELSKVYEVPHEGHGLLAIVSQLLDRVVTRFAQSQDRRRSVEHLPVGPAVEALHETISPRDLERAMKVQYIGNAGAFGEQDRSEVARSSSQGESAVQVHHGDASGRDRFVYSLEDIHVSPDFPNVQARRGRLVASIGASIHQLVLERGRDSPLQQYACPRLHAAGRRGQRRDEEHPHRLAAGRRQRGKFVMRRGGGVGHGWCDLAAAMRESTIL